MSQLIYGPPNPVALALTGASGMQYGLRLLHYLLSAGTEVHLMISKAARAVLTWEMDIQLPGNSRSAADLLLELSGVPAGQLRIFAAEEWTAPLASGSSVPAAMIVCPCSMGTLSAIAVGSSENLIARAADVAIKERRQLILVPRETPFSAIHLRHMTTLAELGVVILAACPGFYHRPRTVEQVVDFIVARILDHLRIAHDIPVRWEQIAGTGASGSLDAAPR